MNLDISTGAALELSLPSHSNSHYGKREICGLCGAMRSLSQAYLAYVHAQNPVWMGRSVRRKQ
jgi:hypothetical protein